METSLQNNLISIIVPVYNVENYIEKCINSLVNQTYTNIEILLIDDGSTDKSGTICKEWSLKDKRIKYFYKKNEGVCSARNKGLEEAKGEFIGFVDSDDWIAPTMYEELYSLLLEYHCDLSICGRIRVIGNKQFEYPSTGVHYFPKGKIEMKYLSCPYDLNISMNKLYHKHLFEKIKFPTNMTYAEDLYIVPDILSQAKNIIYTSKGLYYYFERLDSASFSFNEQKSWNDLNAKEKLYSFLKKQKVNSDIAFDWLFGAYVRGYLYIEKKKSLRKDYKIFFLKNIFKCSTHLKCVLFFISPKLYFFIKKLCKQ